MWYAFSNKTKWHIWHSKYAVLRYDIVKIVRSHQLQNIFETWPPCILICVQQDATLHSLFYLEIALHVSGGTTTHQERKQLYLQHLVFVTPLLLCAASSRLQ